MSKQTYTVIGEQPVLGNEPGATFSADLDPDQAKRLLDGGALAEGNVTPKPPATPKDRAPWPESPKPEPAPEPDPVPTPSPVSTPVQSGDGKGPQKPSPSA